MFALLAKDSILFKINVLLKIPSLCVLPINLIGIQQLLDANNAQATIQFIIPNNLDVKVVHLAKNGTKIRRHVKLIVQKA